MNDIAKAIHDAIETVTDIGGDFEMNIEDTPKLNTPANRAKLKVIVAIDELL